MIENCDNWKVIKTIDRLLKIKNKGKIIKCPYCGKKHKD